MTKRRAHAWLIGAGSVGITILFGYDFIGDAIEAAPPMPVPLHSDLLVGSSVVAMLGVARWLYTRFPMPLRETFLHGRTKGYSDGYVQGVKDGQQGNVSECDTEELGQILHLPAAVYSNEVNERAAAAGGRHLRVADSRPRPYPRPRSER